MNDARERLRRRREKLLNKVFKKELRQRRKKNWRKKFGSQGFCQLKFFSCLLKFSVAKKKLSVAKSICQLPKLDHLATNLQH